jgi:XapX domain-containing protein
MECILAKAGIIELHAAQRWRLREQIVKIAIGFVLSFIIGAGCRYFDIPAASPPVIPGALIVLAMTLGYTSMDRLLIRKYGTATTKHLCGGPTGLPKGIASSTRPSQPDGQARS